MVAGHVEALVQLCFESTKRCLQAQRTSWHSGKSCKEVLISEILINYQAGHDCSRCGCAFRLACFVCPCKLFRGQWV